MGLGILDLIDCNLQLWHADAHAESPGYALLQDDAFLFGSAARAAARIHPRHINTRYWWQLNTEGLQPALGSARHSADLAHNHLLALHHAGGAPEDILLAVSGSMQPEQLSLLLGIAQACPFRPVGLVNRSVALGSIYARQRPLWHLEIQLHQSLLTLLACTGDRIEVQRSVPLPGAGMLQLQDRLAEIIATAFVRQTRFDPRRQAGTEQMLYDALPTALQSLQHSNETNIEVQGYQARLLRDDLSAAGAQLIASTGEFIGTGADIICDPWAALLPGLVETLDGIRITTGDAVHDALIAHGDTLLQSSANLNYVTALHTLGNAVAAAPTRSAQAARPTLALPTHVLSGHTARPLTAAGTPLGNGWAIQLQANQYMLQPGTGSALINGAATPAEPTVLQCGDCIAIDTMTPVTLICVDP